MASRPEIKEEDESGFCKFFRNLAEKHDETVRIFDRGDYYSAHGEDATFIANTVSIRSFCIGTVQATDMSQGLQNNSRHTQARP